MARNYDLDTSAAKEANSGGKRITEPGVYVGTFRAAWFEINDKGTESVGLFFQSEQGQEAGPLMLYTHNGRGEALPSYKTLNAIMACLKVRKLEAKRGNVTFYDHEARKDVQREKDTYPALVGKRVGIVLQGEEQEYQGELKKRLQLAAPFCAETRRMAVEILDQKTTPEALDRYLVWFESNKWRHARGAKAAPARRAEPVGAGADDFEDDIPFN